MHRVGMDKIESGGDATRRKQGGCLGVGASMTTSGVHLPSDGPEIRRTDEAMKHRRLPRHRVLERPLCLELVLRSPLHRAGIRGQSS